MKIDFAHHQSAHCENGVASNLLKHQGISISEPMIFGIGAGIFFVYLPFLKVNHAPVVSFRPMPGLIFKRVVKKLGISLKRKKFRSKQKAEQALIENLNNNIPTGLQVGVYHLSYFPDEYRFHFNAHNLVVFGKTDEGYLISDPVMPEPTVLTPKELIKVRFAKGALAPRGQMYFPTNVPHELKLEKAIVDGIKRACSQMLVPAPLIGVSGIRHVSKQIRKWPKKHGIKKTNHYLGQIVRMQEEIGTGGGGFRYIYAAFLQEAAGVLKNEKLKALSLEMTDIGDKWRDFALNASRVYKNRSNQEDVYNSLADELLEIAELEKVFFKKLKKAV